LYSATGASFVAQGLAHLCGDLIGFGTAGKAVLTSGHPKQDKSFEIRAART
jgi:hypothetical protein